VGGKLKKAGGNEERVKQRAKDMINSDDEDGEGDGDGGVDSDEDDEAESAAEKRLRLAKQFISSIETQERNNVDGKEVDAEAIANRLRDDLDNEKGILSRSVAAHIDMSEAPTMRRFRFKGKPVTCMIMSSDAKSVYCGSKCGSVVQWSLATGQKVVEHERVDGETAVRQGGGKVYERHGNETHVSIQGHTAEVLALAISSDGKFLASAGRDRRIIIWDAVANVLLKQFTGHRDAVASLAFRRRTHQLFSGSLDRTIKVWNLDQMAYVETLYGHQDAITDMDSLDKDACVTAGARDRSARVWKIVEESQLVFQAKPEASSVDCVAMITEMFFVTGSEDGTIAVWDTQKKRPLTAVKKAHGESNWITSLAAMKYGDIVASGSSDGDVKLWNCVPKDRSISLLRKIPVVGFINGLTFDAHGSMLAVGVSQEPRLGRWKRVKEARNGVVVITLFDKDAAGMTSAISLGKR
jgi:ribosomal RNA-processing protein 9